MSLWKLTSLKKLSPKVKDQCLDHGSMTFDRPVRSREVTETKDFRGPQTQNWVLFHRLRHVAFLSTKPNFMRFLPPENGTFPGTWHIVDTYISIWGYILLTHDNTLAGQWGFVGFLEIFLAAVYAGAFGRSGCLDFMIECQWVVLFKHFLNLFLKIKPPHDRHIILAHESTMKYVEFVWKSSPNGIFINVFPSLLLCSAIKRSAWFVVTSRHQSALLRKVNFPEICMSKFYKFQTN